MNGIIAWFARNGVAANLMMVFIVVTGSIAVVSIKEEVFPEIELRLTLAQDPRDLSFEYGINDVPFWRAKPMLAKLGETQVWTVENTTPWSHPIHLHGFFFLVLDENDEPVRPLEWKDTVDVPFKETRRLLVRFDERPGTWIFHCHILDHAQGGLLSAVHLALPPGDFRNMSGTDS